MACATVQNVPPNPPQTLAVSPPGKFQSLDIAPGDQKPSTNEEPSNSSSWSPLYNGGAKLDSDTINYIHRIYCRECRMEEQRRKEKEAGASGVQVPPAPQPVEDLSLQTAMDKNKESLKRKLMLRRSVNELVDQGIYPPLKTPPAYAEQRKQLERAKNADLLKHKIQQRPDRQALVEQHILEDSTAAPLLQVRQQQLKRARLQDSLSDRLANRPGPLELVKGNILQTDPQLQDAIRDGKLQFQTTTEAGEKRSSRSFVFDDDSNSSDGAPSPQTQSGQGTDSDPQSAGSSVSIPTPPDITPLLQKMQQSASTQPKTFVFSQTTMPSITSQSFSPSPPGGSTSLSSLGGSSMHRSSSGNSLNTSGGGKVSRLKKPKPKAPPKSKVIKFHEYKGPPNIVKTTPTNQPCGADGTPYNIMLQQQQLLLQWQLEFQQKNLYILPAHQQKAAAAAAAGSPDTPSHSAAPSPASTPLPIALSPSGSEHSSTSNSQTLSSATVPVPPVINTAASPQPAPVAQPPQKVKALDDYKVADLKAECKKRNLPVSGPKPALLERLKPYADAILNGNQSFTSTSSSPQPQTVSVSSLTSPSSSSVSGYGDMQVMSPQSVQALGNIVNIQPLTPQSVAPSEDSNSMALGSPPGSPGSSSLDLNASQSSLGPLSPDLSMDINIASPPMLSIASQVVPPNIMLGSSQRSIPMVVDAQQLSRPPSVAPMEIDLSGGHSNLNLANAQSVATAAANVTTLTAALNAAARATPLKILSPPLRSHTPSPIAGSAVTIEPTASQQVTPHLVPQTSTATATATPQFISVQVPPQVQVQVGQPQVISQDELVRQQQKQIDDLRRQLQMSQLQLKEAQFAAHSKAVNEQFKLQAIIKQQSSPPAETKPQTSVIQAQPQHAAFPQSQHVQQPVVAQIQLQPMGQPQHHPQPQAQHPIPSIAISTTPMTTSIDSKATLSSLLQHHSALQPNMNFATCTSGTTGQPKLFSFTATSSAPQFIFTSQPDQNANTTTTANTKQQPHTITVPLNGVTTNNRASSVPTSPIGHNKLHRSATNPFFTNIALSKDPPKYDEVVKNKQNQLTASEAHALLANGNAGGILVPQAKSQEMDDVLEILIRSGELPASAAHEPPLTPKREPGLPVQKTSAPTITQLMSAPHTAASTVVMPTSSSSAILFSMPASFSTVSAPVTNTYNKSVDSSSLPSSRATSQTNVTPSSSLASPLPSLITPTSASSSPARKDVPPPLSFSSLSNTLSFGHDLGNGMNISDLPSSLADLPFITMDWSDSDTTMNALDLPDVLDTPNTMRTVLNSVGSPGSSSSRGVTGDPHHDFLNVPGSSGGSTHGGSVHGSEPSLNQLGLNLSEDVHDPSPMMDVSEWLDVIIPSSGLTPLSANAPMAFQSDPILTPKTQDVLDLFNIEEADLYSASDLGGSSFERIMETATSKS